MLMSRVAPVMLHGVSAYGMKTAACSLQKRGLPVHLEELIPADLTAVNTSSDANLAAHFLFGSNRVSGMMFVQATDLVLLWRLFQLTEGEGSEEEVRGSGANIVSAFYCFMLRNFLATCYFFCV